MIQLGTSVLKFRRNSNKKGAFLLLEDLSDFTAFPRNISTSKSINRLLIPNLNFCRYSMEIYFMISGIAVFWR